MNAPVTEWNDMESPYVSHWPQPQREEMNLSKVTQSL